MLYYNSNQLYNMCDLVAHKAGTSIPFWKTPIQRLGLIWPYDPSDEGYGTFSFLTQGDNHGRINDVSHLKGSYFRTKNYASNLGKVDATYYMRYRYHDLTVTGMANGTYAVIECVDQNWGLPDCPPSTAVFKITAETESSVYISCIVTHVNTHTREAQAFTATMSIDSRRSDGEIVATDRVFNWSHLADQLRSLGVVTSEAKYAVYSNMVENLQCNVNNLENVTSILSAGRSIRSGCKTLMSGLSKSSSFFAHISSQIGRGIRPSSARKIPNVSFKDFLHTNVGLTADGWLAYRYQLNTMLMDINEINRYFNTSNVNPNDLLDTLAMCHTVRGGEVIGNCSYHLTFRLGRKQYRSASMTACLLGQQCDAFTINLRRYGFYPSLVNLWDIVPLSFIVDWVLPIGTYLDADDDLWFRDYFDIADVCESQKWQGEFEDIKASLYIRHSSSLPSLAIESRNPSTKTSVMRICDGLALLV